MQTVWHLTVREQGAPASSEHRFVYQWAHEAAAALRRAERAGFVVRVDRVQRMRETVGAS